MFRGASQRCDHEAPAGEQPCYFTPRVRPILAIAGLWDEWRHIETKETIARRRKNFASVTLGNTCDRN